MAAVAVAALLPVSVLAFVAGGDPGADAAVTTQPPPTTPTTRATTTTSVPRESLAPDARLLLDLVDLGRAGTSHARYAVTSARLGDEVTAAELEVWHLGDLVRHDTRIVDAGGEVRTSAIGSPDGTTTCQQPAGGGWACQHLDEPFDPADDFLAGVLELVGRSTVSVVDALVGPYEGRCFALDGAELCLSPTGVPLRVSAGGTTYEAVLVDAEVRESDFRPPA